MMRRSRPFSPRMCYYFYSWLIKKQLFTLGETWPEALITCAVSIAAACLCLKFYDLPVRRWLAKK